MRPFEYSFSPQALKQLKKLPKETAKRIVNKLIYYISTDDPLSFAEQLTDPVMGEFRFRVGKYRIICDVRDESTYILKIGHRRDIYKR